MALNRFYTASGVSYDGRTWTVDIYKDAAAPAQVETLTLPSVRLVHGFQNSDLVRWDMPGELRLVWKDPGTTAYDDLRTLSLAGDTDYQARLAVAGSEMWRGWIVPDLGTRFYDEHKADVQLVARDGFGLMRRAQFDPVTTSFGTRQRLVASINRCLESTGLGRLIRTSNQYYASGVGGVADDPLDVLFADDRAFRLFNADGFASLERLSCFEVLKQICTAFNLRVFQYFGLWYVQQIGPNLRASSVKEFAYNASLVKTGTQLPTRAAEYDVDVEKAGRLVARNAPALKRASSTYAYGNISRTSLLFNAGFDLRDRQDATLPQSWARSPGDTSTVTLATGLPGNTRGGALAIRIDSGGLSAIQRYLDQTGPGTLLSGDTLDLSVQIGAIITDEDGSEIGPIDTGVQATPGGDAAANISVVLRDQTGGPDYYLALSGDVLSWQTSGSITGSAIKVPLSGSNDAFVARGLVIPGSSRRYNLQTRLWNATGVDDNVQAVFYDNVELAVDPVNVTGDFDATEYVMEASGTTATESLVRSPTQIGQGPTAGHMGYLSDAAGALVSGFTNDPHASAATTLHEHAGAEVLRLLGAPSEVIVGPLRPVEGSTAHVSPVTRLLRSGTYYAANYADWDLASSVTTVEVQEVGRTLLTIDTAEENPSGGAAGLFSGATDRALISLSERFAALSETRASARTSAPVGPGSVTGIPINLLGEERFADGDDVVLVHRYTGAVTAAVVSADQAAADLTLSVEAAGGGGVVLAERLPRGSYIFRTEGSFAAGIIALDTLIRIQVTGQSPVAALGEPLTSATVGPGLAKEAIAIVLPGGTSGDGSGARIAIPSGEVLRIERAGSSASALVRTTAAVARGGSSIQIEDPNTPGGAVTLTGQVGDEIYFQNVDASAQIAVLADQITALTQGLFGAAAGATYGVTSGQETLSASGGGVDNLQTVSSGSAALPEAGELVTVVGQQVGTGAIVVAAATVSAASASAIALNQDATWTIGGGARVTTGTVDLQAGALIVPAEGFQKAVAGLDLRIDQREAVASLHAEFFSSFSQFSKMGFIRGIYTGGSPSTLVLQDEVEIEIVISFLDIDAPNGQPLQIFGNVAGTDRQVIVTCTKVGSTLEANGTTWTNKGATNANRLDARVRIRPTAVAGDPQDAASFQAAGITLSGSPRLIPVQTNNRAISGAEFRAQQNAATISVHADLFQDNGITTSSNLSGRVTEAEAQAGLSAAFRKTLGASAHFALSGNAYPLGSYDNVVWLEGGGAEFSGTKEGLLVDSATGEVAECSVQVDSWSNNRLRVRVDKVYRLDGTEQTSGSWSTGSDSALYIDGHLASSHAGLEAVTDEYGARQMLFVRSNGTLGSIGLAAGGGESTIVLTSTNLNMVSVSQNIDTQYLNIQAQDIEISGFDDFNIVGGEIVVDADLRIVSGGKIYNGDLEFGPTSIEAVNNPVSGTGFSATFNAARLELGRLLGSTQQSIDLDNAGLEVRTSGGGTSGNAFYRRTSARVAQRDGYVELRAGDGNGTTPYAGIVFQNTILGGQLTLELHPTLGLTAGGAKILTAAQTTTFGDSVVLQTTGANPVTAPTTTGRLGISAGEDLYLVADDDVIIEADDDIALKPGQQSGQAGNIILDFSGAGAAGLRVDDGSNIYTGVNYDGTAPVAMKIVNGIVVSVTT